MGKDTMNNGVRAIRIFPAPIQDKEKASVAATNAANNGCKASPSAGAAAATHRPVQVWFVLPFRLLCQICLTLPLAGLVACLLIAVVFQFGDIQETACKVSTRTYSTWEGVLSFLIVGADRIASSTVLCEQ